MQAGLNFRRDHPELFGEGEYIPLEVTGERADNVVAFGRRSGEDVLIVVATRLPLRLLDNGVPLVAPASWNDTRITVPADARGSGFRDVLFPGESFTAGEIPVSEALARFPVALLYNGAGG
jgi:(1->4)-alpha-D-glucan 1-alpha-D-glucosylmutase